MPKIEKLFEYHVTGFWPFPIDMLRRDQARGATPQDQEKIDVLSRETRTDGWHQQVTIQLHGTSQPTRKRWQSFGWEVYGSVNPVEVTRPLTAEEQLATLELIRQARASLPAAEAEVASARKIDSDNRAEVRRLEHLLAEARHNYLRDEHAISFRQEEVDAINANIERMLKELD